jgi:transcriptional regulator with XRE-family HTH domain
MDGLNTRLKAWRAAKELSQDAAALVLGLPVSSYQRYELGTRGPSTDAMEAFVLAGINANWLLTGHGPMLLADLADATRGPDILDRERMDLALATIERGLAKANAEIAPEKKGRLLLAIYDYLEEEGVTENTVANIIRLAA